MVVYNLRIHLDRRPEVRPGPDLHLDLLRARVQYCRRGGKVSARYRRGVLDRYDVYRITCGRQRRRQFSFIVHVHALDTLRTA
jgi:hypothetical protein